MFSKGLRIALKNGSRIVVKHESDAGVVTLAPYSAYATGITKMPAAQLAGMIEAGEARVENEKWDKFTAMIAAAETAEDAEILTHARSLACANERPAFLRGKTDKQILEHCYRHAKAIARWNS